MVPSEEVAFENGVFLLKKAAAKRLKVRVELSASLPADSARYVESDLRQILEDLGLTGKIRIE